MWKGVDADMEVKGNTDIRKGGKSGGEEVWGKRENAQAVPGEGEDGDGKKHVGADAVLAETLQQNWRNQEPPAVTAMGKLSLLGS